MCAPAQIIHESRGDKDVNLLRESMWRAVRASSIKWLVLNNPRKGMQTGKRIGLQKNMSI